MSKLIVVRFRGDSMIGQVQSKELILDQNMLDLKFSMSLDWEQGELLEGDIISYGENKVTVEIEGVKLDIKSSEKIGEVGDKVKFLVEKVTENELVLKALTDNQEIRPIKQYDRIQSVLLKEVIPMTEQNIELAKKMLDSGIQVEKEIFEKVAQAKRQIEQIINTMTREEVRELLESPYDAEKISIDIISRFLCEKGKFSKAISSEELEKELNQYVGEKTEKVKVAMKALLEKELPVTRKNIDSLVLVQEKLEAIKNMDDKAIEQVVKRKLPYTLNHLYAAIFSAGEEEIQIESKLPYGDAGLINTGEHEFSQDEIIKLLKHQEMPIDEEHIEAANFLIKHKLEVNKENLEAVILLKHEIKKLDEKIVLDKALKFLKLNSNPGKLELFEDIYKKDKSLTENEIKQLVRDIKVMDDEALKRVIRKNLSINLRNLQKELNSIAEEKNVDEESPLELEKGSQFINAKRQLEEVRLKMTLEAALKLNEKIKIDTVPLKELVEELKSLEQEYYREALHKAGAESSKENLEQLEALYNKLETINKSGRMVLAKVVKNEIPPVIDDLYKQTLQEKEVITKYEQMETRVEPRLGDVIRKIEKQIAPLLKEQGIEPTEENIRCARILIQNNMEVNEENILQVRVLDEKVNFISKNLHPIIAANMIKEGFRPDFIPIDEVIDYIEVFDELLGKDPKEALGQFILELDEKGALSPQEREGLIGIYRMLHVIEKSNGKVIGWLMKNNIPLTLNNLVEAAKYLARTRGVKQNMDVLVDDDFGFSEKVIYHEKSIRAQLEKAFGEKVTDSSRFLNFDSISKETTEQLLDSSSLFKLDYYELILDEFVRNMSSEKFIEWLSKNPDLYEMDLESLYEEYKKEDLIKEGNLSKTPVKEETVEEFTKTLQVIKKVNQETLIFMEKNQIPMNLKNLQLVSGLLENPHKLGEEIESFSNLLKETDYKDELHQAIREINEKLKQGMDPEEAQDELKEKIKEIKGQLLESLLPVKQTVWKTGNDIEKMIDIGKQLQKQDGFYQIPVIINGKAANMNVYLLKDRDKGALAKKESISAYVAIETEHLGQVRMVIHMDEKNVDFKISGESKEVTEYLKSKEHLFRASIENIGYKVLRSQFKEELKELVQSSKGTSLVVNKKKHLDSDFEMVV